RVDAWVSLVDVAPTLAELLCLPGRADWQLQLEGRSLVPYLRGETPPAAPVFAMSGHSYFPHLVRRRVRFDSAGRFRTVIEGRHKLIWTPGATPGQRFELYDLVDDPEERSDLSDLEPKRRAALQHRLNAWMRRLRQLGYVE
ncbi:MAG: hypothetical protein JRG84_08545, partial [Deltaproteobacteria bacterium]|nr:hypothetical protein [Deltaproteobacteria bacterium]